MKYFLIAAVALTLSACNSLRDFAISEADRVADTYAAQYAAYCKIDDRAIRQAWYDEFVKELKNNDPNLPPPPSFDCNNNGIPDLEE